MQSNLKLHLKPIPAKTGTILLQSTSCYFAHIAVLDYNFTKKASIDFSITSPSYIMVVDRAESSCYLCYHPRGKYSKSISAGTNQIAFITFKTDWFVYKCEHLPKLKPFNTLLSNPENQELSLPTAGIAESLYKCLQKMEVMNSNLDQLDHDGYHFANSCINKYYNNLKNQNTTRQVHDRLATTLSNYVRTHFRTELVEDIPGLAKRFMVSERNLARFANIAFGIPLHEQVIKLRMDDAVFLLRTSTKTIKEIALLCGYKDPYYFSKAFKKYQGKSPGSFREEDKN